jgi:hypothetical protein
MSTQEISSVSLECRDMRHAWRRVGDNILVERKGKIRVFTRTLECPRCETLRIDTYRITAQSVERVHSRYAYPKGYHVKGGLKVGDARYLLFKDMTFKEELK